MIIDSHTHIGSILKFHMPEDMLLSSLDRYGVEYALVSNAEAAEMDNEQKPIPPEQQFSQQALNEKLVHFVRRHPDRLGALLWIKPRGECCDEAFERLVVENHDVVFGLKVHPYHSKTALDDPRLEPYLDLARRHALPVVTHTANDHESSPAVAYQVALKHPEIDFVMVHLGLVTDNREAIDLVSRLPNLYGDSTWVTPDKVRLAIQCCGSDKILFGTDNPINGPDTYNDPVYYNDYFAGRLDGLSTADYEKFTFRNAIRLFKLTRFKDR